MLSRSNSSWSAVIVRQGHDDLSIFSKKVADCHPSFLFHDDDDDDDDDESSVFMRLQFYAADIFWVHAVATIHHFSARYFDVRVRAYLLCDGPYFCTRCWHPVAVHFWDFVIFFIIYIDEITKIPYLLSFCLFESDLIF